MDKQHQFHFPDGTSASSVDGLRDKIESMSYELFYHHVHDGVNDFANWVRHVLKDPMLADDLQNVTSIVETVEVLNDYLHPRVAQDHLDKLDDITSNIEHETGADHFPMEPSEAPEPVEDSLVQPEMTPSQPEEVVQEIFQPESAPDDAVHEVEVDLPEHDLEGSTPNLTEDPIPSASESHHYRKDEPEKQELEQFHHDIGTLIVKDFIWGFIFGIIVGFLLTKMFGLA